MPVIKDGFAAPFIKVFYLGKEIQDKITKLRYVYDEEDNDEIEITVEAEDKEVPDEPQWQEDVELKVQWGFIAEVSVTRKVWVAEPKWEFGKDNIKGTIKCVEKGHSLKGSTSKKVHKGKSLAGIAQDMADKHGLKAYMEIPGTQTTDFNLVPLPGENIDKYLIRERVEKERRKLEHLREHPETAKVLIKDALNAVGAKTNDTLASREAELRDKYQKLYFEGNPVDVNKAVERDLKFENLLRNLKVNKNVPQANKSDLQTLKQLGAREPDGPWLAETRDDELIIKKRNFNQAPFATYTYKGGDGRLIDFNPETKKRNKKGTSTRVGFSGWNPMDKTFFEGEVNPADGSSTLSSDIEMLRYYKGLQKNIPGGLGGKLTTSVRVGKTYLPFINNNNVAAKIDNAGLYTRRFQTAEVTVDNKVTALEKAIVDNTEKFITDPNKKKDIYNAIGVSPKDAHAHAANHRRASELKKNQIRCSVWGDPNLKVGIVINIQGVSKKYLGNYYVVKCSHELSKDAAYITELELVRQGHNSKVNENYTDAKSIGRTPNKQQGPTDSTEQTKPIKIRTNVKLSEELKIQ